MNMKTEKTETLPETETAPELRRGIRDWQIALIGTGGVVGSCYFLGLGPLVHDMGPAVILAYLAVALVVYGMMLSYAELLVNLPCKGSFVSYAKEFMGPVASASIGWAFWFNWVCYVPSEVIGISVIIDSYFPGNETAYAIGTLLCLTVINLCAVDIFAKIESSLAILKICIIVLFCLVGLGVWVGLWGSEGFLGAAVNFGGGFSFSSLFPNGVSIVLTSMVVVLVNFQGIEILGLAAAETQNAEKAVPKACKTATFLCMGIYLLPIIVLLAIFPTAQATLDGTIFAQVLSYYHLDILAAAISVAVLFASFSCANTGLFGTVRALYGLASEGLAPTALKKLDKRGNPRGAVLFTLLAMWIVLMFGISGGGSAMYESLLSVAGFTGAAAWMSIIICQKRFRARLKRSGRDPQTCLRAAVPAGKNWMTYYALIAQGIALVMLAFGEGQQIIFLIACLALVIPAAATALLHRRGKLPAAAYEKGEFASSDLLRSDRAE